DYRRRVKVEASDDGKEWSSLLDPDEHQLIFFKADTQFVHVHQFSYPDNRRRFLRVTVYPDPGKKDDRPAIKGVTVYESAEEKGEYVTLSAQLGEREETRVDGISGSVWTITSNGQRV